MANITAVQMIIPSGKLDLTIFGREVITGANRSIEVFNIDELTYKNEVISADSEVTGFSYIQGKQTLTVYDVMSDGNSLKQLLDASFIANGINQILDCELTFTDRSAVAFPTRLVLTYNNYKYDATKKETVITLSPKAVFNPSQTASVNFAVGTGTITVSGTAVTGTGTNFLSELSIGKKILVLDDDSLLQGRTIVGIASNTVATIDEALTVSLGSSFGHGASLLDVSIASLYNSTYSVGFDFDSLFSTFFGFLRQYFSIIFNKDSIFIYSSFKDSAPSIRMLREIPLDGELDFYVSNSPFKCIDLIPRFALLEGSIWGNFFGKSFYLHRLDNGAADTALLRRQIDWDKVLIMNDLSGKVTQKSVGVTVALADDQYPAILPASTSSVLYNQFAEKFVNLLFKPVGLCQGQYNITGTPEFVDPTRGIDLDLVKSGQRAYAKCFGADGSRRLELTISGCGEYLPYHRLTFNSATPARFRLNGASTRQFAISQLKYNWTENTTFLEIYEIGVI